MAPKPKGKNWNELHMAVTAIAITGTLGFWNLFATPATAQGAAKVTDPTSPPPPPPATDPAVTVDPTSTVLSLRPVKIIYGGTVPQMSVVQVTPTGAVVASTTNYVPSAPAAPAKKRGGGGGGGGGGSVGGGGSTGGGGTTNPAPPPSTGSSKKP